MKKILKISAGFLILLCSSFAVFAATADWSYQGNTGPAYWAKLSPANAACANQSVQQSPMSLPLSTPTSAPTLYWHFQPGTFQVQHNQHNLYLYYTGPKANEYVQIDNVKYYLQQIHFHVPGEHKLGSRSYPMEVHLVHEGPNSQPLAVGVWLQSGAANSFLSAVFAKPIPAVNASAQPTLTLNPVDLLPKQSRYYRYTGTLTAPPCQTVSWIMLKNAITVSNAQLAQFKTEVTADNARPVQPQVTHQIDQGTGIEPIA